MSDSTLHSTNSAENDFADNSDFEFSDYLFFDEWLEENPASLAHGFVQGSAFSTMNDDDSGKSSSQHGESSSSKRRGSDGEKSKRDDRAKVAFKIKSELDVLDDGFKWRKYGKKMVKNSPNPRNYYRCSVEGCPVKKRVERDAGDPQYVITTYEGIHTHESPSL